MDKRRFLLLRTVRYSLYFYGLIGLIASVGLGPLWVQKAFGACVLLAVVGGLPVAAFYAAAKDAWRYDPEQKP